MASRHDPYELPNASAVFKLHRSFEGRMFFGIGGSSGGVESFEPIAFRRERGGAIFGERDLGEPRGKVFSLVGNVDIFYVAKS